MVSRPTCAPAWGCPTRRSNRHGERSEAIHPTTQRKNGLLRRFAPRNDDLPCLTVEYETHLTSSLRLQGRRRHSNRFAARHRCGIADRGYVGLVGFHGAALEHRRARDKGVGTGGGELTGYIRTDAAIHLDVD